MDVTIRVIVLEKELSRYDMYIYMGFELQSGRGEWFSLDSGEGKDILFSKMLFVSWDLACVS